MSVALKELKAAMLELDACDDVKVIILTGAGKSFVAGADISEMKPLGAIEGREFGLLGQSVFTTAETLFDFLRELIEHDGEEKH